MAIYFFCTFSTCCEQEMERLIIVNSKLIIIIYLEIFVE